MDGADAQIRFDVPAIVRKWPSLNNSRSDDSTGPYLVAEGTLDECIRHFMARPEKTRHLYDIQITPQLPLVTEILTSEYIIELARLRDFSEQARQGERQTRERMFPSSIEVVFNHQDIRVVGTYLPRG